MTSKHLWVTCAPARTDDGWMMPRWYFLFPPTYRHSIPYHVVLYVPHVRDSRLHTTHRVPRGTRRPSSDRPIRECATRRSIVDASRTVTRRTRRSRRRTSRDSIAVWERARRRHGGGIVWITLASSRSDRRSSDADVHRSVTTGDGVRARVNGRGRWVRWSGDRSSVEWTRDG